MQVSDLIKLLEKMPQDAHVVITGEVVNGIELRRGDIRDGAHNRQFRYRDGGRETALVFTANTIMGTGRVVAMAR